MTLACDNGVDDDGDGLVDYAADPGCSTLDTASEAAECQDAASCEVIGKEAGSAWRKSERGCGLGAELVVALALLLAARRTGIRGSQRLS